METDVGEASPYMDVLPGMAESDNVDWVHLAATIDTWGNRGTTWVTPKGSEIPQLVPLHMLRAMHVLSSDIQSEDLTGSEETTTSSENVDQSVARLNHLLNLLLSFMRELNQETKYWLTTLSRVIWE